MYLSLLGHTMHWVYPNFKVCMIWASDVTLAIWRVCGLSGYLITIFQCMESCVWLQRILVSCVLYL